MCIGSIDVSRCVIYTLMLLSVHQFCSQVRQLCRGILKFQTMRTAPRRRKTGPVGPSSPRGSRRFQRWLWILNCPHIGGRTENIDGICIYTSTLHFRGKNGSSKNIGQTTPKISHFIPNMYVSGKISALRPCTHIVGILYNF